ncbi:MAG: hypothetical protein B7Y56_15475 [Gallionellales bacterium 35-53-114]|jgi:hypothetical protein|nr:MAG: hypothetical protein B7Y56_15475 [Gallionellales bacterium 35-53-114]OYZ62176.1 MAG: hypothetical protein B7Y04_15085 [Gallionellales bacterium 24-53-125]OZB07235.1 MAG: hypothetical protein B7X61_15325 [Gallionellales bacterium 39-52-133]HQS59809.1 DUF6488 family protein [Gallionellaceae bacterium]HQS76563.1 DUF6488 family protein [Gallionellaceae bacterium]
MRNISTALLVSSLLIASPVMAGAGHDHTGGGHSHGPVSSEVVVKKASAKVKALVDSGKLDKSWFDVKAEGAAQKVSANVSEWVVTFKNEKENDVAKQKLYLFFTLDGMYIATNFTGK